MTLAFVELLLGLKHENQLEKVLDWRYYERENPERMELRKDKIEVCWKAKCGVYHITRMTVNFEEKK